MDEAFQIQVVARSVVFATWFGGVELVLEDRASALGVNALVARKTYVQTGGVAGDGNVCQVTDDVITQLSFCAAVGAVAEGFSWCGFDDGDVLAGDVGAGDVDA